MREKARRILFIAVMASCLLLSAALADGILLGTTQAGGAPGGTVTVKVTIASGDTGWAGLAFDFDYDEAAFKLRDVKFNDSFGWSAVNAQDEGTVHATFANAKNVKASGTIMTLKFDVKGKAVNGVYTPKITPSANNTFYISGGDYARVDVTTSVEPMTVTSSKLTKIEILYGDEHIPVGDKLALVVRATPENAPIPQIRWSSDDEGVATVDKNGVVTGISQGSANITAEADGLSDIVTITVAEDDTPVSSGLIIKVLAVQNGKRMNLPVIAGCDVTWSSEDASIAAIVKNKAVKGLKLAQTTLFAKIQSATGKAVTIDGTPLQAGEKYAITLNVRKKGELPTGVKLLAKKLTLNLADNPIARVYAYVKPEKKALDDEIFWVSADPAIASVDQRGQITAHKIGKVKVTAYAANQKRGVVTVTVEGKKTDIKITDESGTELKKLAIKREETFQLRASNDVTWSSKNPKIASVDPETGLVTALKKGTATITAIDADGNKATIKVTVKKKQIE